MKEIAKHGCLILTMALIGLVGGCEDREQDIDQELDDVVNQVDGSLRSVADSANKAAIEAVRYELVPVPQRDPGEYMAMVDHVREPREISLVCKYVDFQPVIDGVADEEIWGQVNEIETLDYSSQRPITLKTYHNGENIYFLAKFPDPTASEQHKTLVWSEKEQVYIEAMDREDTLVLKWSMAGGNMSFDPALLEPHAADIWFWKACRSNPAGYLDDKSQIVSIENVEGGLELSSEKQGRLFLLRKADEGRSCVSEEMFFENYGPAVKKFYSREPQGSRADIKGRGKWVDGYWTIEFTRKLNTGNSDDVVFNYEKDNVFGVSLYEMAATGVERSWHKPLFRTGNIFDTIALTLESKP
ncbi:MAG: hypothetical protein JXM68_10305 [Sedimentisphaerales bacterium]|nr:hypothetical protein [Sedimentisphaerales bacterium]